MVADRVPVLNIRPSCHAATTAAASVKRGEGNCMRDENTARAKLKQEWGQFTPQQKSRCVRLATLGGLPSYVELLTCLELGKAAGKLPATRWTTGRAHRRGK